MSTTRFRLVFHVPATAAAACKSAIFAAGAGRQGNYSECCFTAAGKGQFRPTAGANPAIGQVGALEEVEELRVEALCVGEETTRKVVAALKRYVHTLPTTSLPIYVHLITLLDKTMVFILLMFHSFGEIARIRMRSPHTAFLGWRISEGMCVVSPWRLHCVDRQEANCVLFRG
jgi:hypothetical protein